MNKKIIYFLACFLGFMQLGCISYQDVEFVSFDKLSIKNISFTGVDLGITVTIENPNNYKIKIVDADIDLEIAGKPVGKIIVPEKLVLDKKSKKQQTFVVATGVSKLSKSFGPTLMALLGNKKIRIKANGSFKAKAFAVGKKFLVNFDDEINMEGSLTD